MLAKTKILLLIATVISPTIGQNHPPVRKACSILKPNGFSPGGVQGIVIFDQLETFIKITVRLSGLKPGSVHGFHIHETGDLKEGCTSFGPHYNPTHRNHGGPLDRERHVGDLGNVVADAGGYVNLVIDDPILSLNGQFSIYGRGVVLHLSPDDLGRGGNAESALTGNSGARIACGAIRDCPPPPY